ncbi:MAG: ABC transporter permease [Deinococcales bacterium]
MDFYLVDFYLEALRQSYQLIRQLDPLILDALLRSLKIATIATVIAALIGIPLGALIALYQFRGKRLVITFFSTLMGMPTVVVGLLLYGLYTRKGILGDWGLLYTETALISAEALLSFPIITRLTISALTKIDLRFKQTLITLGAKPWQVIYLSLREVINSIAAAIITGYGRAISEVGAAMIVGGNIKGRTRTLTTAIALETSKGEFPLALAMGLCLLMVFLFLNLLLLKLQNVDS